MINLTTAAAAKFFGVSTKIIDQLCKERELPFHMIRGSRRFSVEDLQAYADAHRFGHRSQDRRGI